MNDLVNQAKEIRQQAGQELPHDRSKNLSADVGRILVSGGGGYIGRRLVSKLVAMGCQVRVMVVSSAASYDKIWPGVEVVEANAFDLHRLQAALEDVDIAYYLIHSLHLREREFEASDVTAARNFSEAAGRTGVGRIIYLGGMGDVRCEPGTLLYRRRKVEEELRKGSAAVTTLRAPVIIGSGSTSYEILMGLAKRLPVVLVPRWAKNRVQPIGIRDLIRYLAEVVSVTETAGGSYEICGGDVLTYEEMLMSAAELLGRKPRSLRSPFSAMGFYAYMAGLLTPVPYGPARAQMEGLRYELVCRDDSIRQLVPFEPGPYRTAILQAISKERHELAEIRWTDAYPPLHELAPRFSEIGDRISYSARYSLPSRKSPAALFNSMCAVGGQTGWFRNSWMWRVRGGIDRITKGVGTARGRKSYSGLRVNDVIDFWRVEEIEEGRKLLLRAEMKLPGRAWLEFNVDGEEGESLLSLSAYYQTSSFWGKVYWYLFLPFHQSLFKKLLEDIERRS